MGNPSQVKQELPRAVPERFFRGQKDVARADFGLSDVELSAPLCRQIIRPNSPKISPTRPNPRDPARPAGRR